MIDMNEFVQAYMEYDLEAEAQETEYKSVAVNCYCENANDDKVRFTDHSSFELVTSQILFLMMISATIYLF